MNYLTKAYFKGEILIPNLIESVQDDYIVKELYAFIAFREPEFLIKVMGQDLYDEFIAGLIANPVLAKWTNLKTQIYWTQNVKVSENDQVGETYYLSPAANYVYFYYMKNSKTISTGAGEVKVAGQGMVYVPNKEKQLNAWNGMAKSVKVIRQWIEEHRSDYPDFDPSKYLKYMTTFGS